MKKKIKRELPVIGTVLYHHYYKKPIDSARIVKEKSFASGRAIEYKGKRFETLTGCAVYITGKPTNGWEYWRETSNRKS